MNVLPHSSASESSSTHASRLKSVANVMLITCPVDAHDVYDVLSMRMKRAIQKST